MKQFIRYLFTMAIVLVLLIVIDVGVFAYLNVKSDSVGYYFSISNISEDITNAGTDYVIADKAKDELDQVNAFVLLIGEDGDVCWKYNVPNEVPTHYTMTDVAGFSRWYLCDYPVYTWVREDGILVIGLPKDSMWKFTINYRLSTFTSTIKALPYVMICNVIVLFLLPLWITKRFEKTREQKRSEWIAGVSHDIRTPLSIVMGHSENDSVIQKQCIRIRDLVSNLNTENKLEAGTGKWNKDDIKIAGLVRDIVCDYANICDEKYIFDLDIDSLLEDKVITADENLIRRMLDNLISNSIHHNEDGCEIKITLGKAQNDKVRLIISDNGVGVSDEKLKEMNGRLKFNYLPEHGLGVRVVKQIAKKYRYKILFHSEQSKYFTSEIIMN